MDKEKQIIEIATDVLKTEGLNLSSSPETIEAWDSLSHAMLIDKIEKHFDLKIEMLEMLELDNLQDVLVLVESKMQK